METLLTLLNPMGDTVIEKIGTLLSRIERERGVKLGIG